MRARHLMTCLSFALTLSAASQISKGSLFFGGDFAFSYEKGTNNNINFDVSGFYLAPVFGVAIKENFVAGTYLLYYSLNSDVPEDFNDVKQRIYGAGFFARQYFALGKSRFSIFLQEQVSVQKDKIDQAFNTIDRIEQDLLVINAGAFPGISFKLSRKLQLESGFSNLLGIRYIHRETSSGTINPVYGESNRLDLYVSAENLSQFYVGFRLFILK